MADPALAAADIDFLYLNYGDRHAADYEISYWQSWFPSVAAADKAADLAVVRHAIIDDPQLGPHVLDQIRYIYEDYAGRRAEQGEIDYWRGQLYNGALYSSVEFAVINSADGQRRVPEAIRDTFLELRGTPPDDAESNYWLGQITQLAGLNALRTSLLSDSAVQAHVTAQLTTLYNQYEGRAPNTGEIAVWLDLYRHGANADTVVDEMLSDRTNPTPHLYYYDSTGANYLNVTVPADFHYAVVNAFGPFNDGVTLADPSILHGKSVYDTSFAREIRDAAGHTDVLLTIDADHLILLKGAHLGDLQDTTYPQIQSTYQAHFARSATTDEVAVWKGLLASGVSQDVFTDAAMKAPGSHGLNHIDSYATAADDKLYTPGLGYGDMVVHGFDPAHDAIRDDGVGYFHGRTAQEILANAHEVVALDGHTDVLITLDYNHSVLVLDVHLAQLSAANFIL